MTTTLGVPVPSVRKPPSAVVVDPPAWRPDAFRVRAARLATSAERAVAVFPEVVTARFVITGGPEAPGLDLHCVLRDGEDTDAVVETLTVKVVEDLEQLLGVGFADRRVRVVVDPSLPRVGVGVVLAG